MSECRFLIIGGGVAGLAVANRLVDLGMEPHLIEAGPIPTDKLCGEFFWPQCLPLLTSWDCEPSHTFDRALVEVRGRSFSYPFSAAAGGGSRERLDRRLADRAVAKGATLQTGVRVDHVRRPGAGRSHYEVYLSSREVVRAETLFFCTGQLPSEGRYVTMKAHFRGDLDKLRVAVFWGAYVMMTPIGEGRIALRCVALKKRVAQFPSAADFAEALLARVQGVHLGARVSPWLVASMGNEAALKPRTWENAYFVGEVKCPLDLIGGGGLALGLLAGSLAAEHAVQKKPEGYLTACNHLFQKKFRWVRWLHRLILAY